MPGPRVPPQIVRLVLLTVLIVGTYGVARYLLTPPTFGDLGFYRAQALGEVAAHAPAYAGRKACDICHADKLKQLDKGEHKTVSCESCHGPCQAHVDNYDIKTARIVCVRCHAVDPARSTWIRQIEPKKHYAGQRCVECHVPHQPNEVPP